MIKNISKILCVCLFIIIVCNCGDNKSPTETEISTPPADVHENKVPKPSKTSQQNLSTKPPNKTSQQNLPTKPIKKNTL